MGIEEPEYEITWEQQKICRLEETNEIYKATLEEVYEILNDIEDYEEDIKEMKKIIKECEIEVAKLD